jgi:peptidoglycan/xylan/chitin deacetylase (PgdA/CDA1 family)
MTEASDYPRDLRGYGRSPPHARWPGDARVAVQFVVNYEEGGENNVLHGDAASEAFLSEVVGAVPWPGQRHMNMESMYEYGARAGFWRLWRAFTSRGMPVTVFAVAHALMRGREQAAAMGEAGWEIASHGLNGSSTRISRKPTSGRTLPKPSEFTRKLPVSDRSACTRAAAQPTRSS